MKIISGKYKNRVIQTLPTSKSAVYKPTSSKVRAAVFNMISHSKYAAENLLLNSVVADICCGSGSFGFEALSRGAQKAFFIDSDQSAIKLIKLNQGMLSIENEQIEALCLEGQSAIKKLNNINIMFIDPPYQHQLLYEKILSAITSATMSEQHLIILEANIRHNIPISERFTLLEQRSYGNTKILLLQLKTSPSI